MSDEIKPSSAKAAADDGKEITEPQTTEETADEKILRLEAELAEANSKYLRALAEQQNLIKRQSVEKDEFVKYANEEILSEFISVYDHLKLSIGSLPDNEKDSAWVKGVEYTVKQFKDLLNVNGVEEIKTVGEKFDHNTMEALEGQGEKVAKEIMPGYKLNGKVIRAARVALE
jgi:molecular chaperone GrpE